MDSLTQAVLGASVGQALMGKHVGRFAPIMGAALGTLPDLDVLISFGGAVEDFTYHRSFSHSLLVHLVITPLLVWLILKFKPQQRVYRTHWTLTILAILWTHAILDAFTVYGTQLLWPLTEHPFGISSVFIIDPSYTIPLLVGLGLAAKWGWQSERAQKAAFLTLFISTAYLGWSLYAKSMISDLTERAVAHSGINSVDVLSTPAPFNTFLWRVLVLGENEYHVGYMVVWDEPEEIEFKRYPKGEELLKNIRSEWDVERLEWFSKGFYKVEKRDDKVVISDLRMGVETSYVFNFVVGNRLPNGQVESVRAYTVQDVFDLSKIPLLWHRLWDPNISLHPTGVELPDANEIVIPDLT